MNVVRPEDATVVPRSGALIEIPVMETVVCGGVNDFEVAIEGSALNGGRGMAIVAKGFGEGPVERSAVAVVMANGVRGSNGPNFEITVAGTVAAFIEVAVVDAPLGPGIRIAVGIGNAVFGVGVDVALAVAEPAVAGVAPACSPGIAHEPGAEVVVVANDNDAVAAYGDVGLLGVNGVSHVGTPPEVLVDVEAGGDGADGVEPVLLVLDRIEADVVVEADGAAVAIGSGSVGQV